MTSNLTAASAIFTMVTSMMGAGINFMPKSFNGVGYKLGFLMIGVVGFFTFFSLYTITMAAKASSLKTPTYTTLAEAISTKLQLIVEVSIFFTCYGSIVFFYRYLTEVLMLMFPFIVTKTGSRFRGRLLITLLLTIPFYFLGIQKNLSNLKIISYCSTISIFYLCSLMIFYAFYLKDKAAKPAEYVQSKKFSEGISVFFVALACQSNMVKTYTEMAKKTETSITIVAVVSSFLGVLIYSIVGMCGLYVFGRSINTSIIEIMAVNDSYINRYIRRRTFDKYAILPKIACYGAILVLLGGYSMMMNPTVNSIYDILKISDKYDETKIRKCIVSNLLITLIFIVSKENMSISTILELIGATAINLTSFFFPCIYYIFGVEETTPTKIMAIFLSVLSITMMFYMTYNILCKKK